MLAHFSLPRWCFHAQQVNRQRFMSCQTSVFIRSVPKRKSGARKSATKNINRIALLAGTQIWCTKSANLVNANKQKNLSRKCTFCKRAIADQLSALNRIAYFPNTQLQISLRPLTASALFAKVQLQISLRPLTASHFFQKCQVSASKVSIR